MAIFFSAFRKSIEQSSLGKLKIKRSTPRFFASLLAIHYISSIDGIKWCTNARLYRKSRAVYSVCYFGVDFIAFQIWDSGGGKISSKNTLAAQ